MMIQVSNQDYFLYQSAYQQKHWTARSQNSRSKTPRIYPIYQEVVVWMLESMRSCYFWWKIVLNPYDVDKCKYQVILGCYEFLHITAGYHNGSLHSCLNLKKQNFENKMFLSQLYKNNKHINSKVNNITYLSHHNNNVGLLCYQMDTN